MERKVAARVEAQRWYLRFPRGVPVALFLLVSAITGLSVLAIERVESQRAEVQQRQMADSITAAIERLANANAVYLRAGASLLSVQGEVSPEVFREFSRQLDHDASLRSGGAMGYAVLVDRSQLGAFTAALRARGLAGFTVHPDPAGGGAGSAGLAGRTEVMPVIFVEPDSAANRTGVGFDFLSDPLRRATVERARRSGRPTASGAIELLLDVRASDHTGFAILMPVYAGPPSLRRLRGVIARGFNAQAFLGAALAPEHLRDYGVALLDAEAPGRTVMAVLGVQAPLAQRIRRDIAVADHHMRLEISPPIRAGLSGSSLLTLIFGLTVSALLLVVARLVTRQAAEDRATLDWFEEQAAIRTSLTRELNHRVKNTLANVLSIVALTRRRASGLDDFVEGLVGRVRALSATHDLLTQSDWGTTPIRAVIEAELAPYVHDDNGLVRMAGPAVDLAPQDALSLGLAIHELATNAAKYGALSVIGAQLEVTWQPVGAGLVQIDWTEHGGPPVPAKRRRGFGTELIEKIVAHELRNPVDLAFPPEGVRCRLVVPVRSPAPFHIRSR